MQKAKHKIVLECIENIMQGNPRSIHGIYEWMRGEVGLFDVRAIEKHLFHTGQIQKKKNISPKTTGEGNPTPQADEYEIPHHLQKQIILSACHQERSHLKNDTAFEKKLNWLREIIHLNPTEYKVLRLYAYLKRSSVLNLFLQDLYAYCHRSLRVSWSLNDYPETLNFTETTAQKALAVRGKLIKSGMLVDEPRLGLGLNNAVYNFLKMPLRSKDELRQLLIGTLAQPTIPLNEYPFLGTTPAYLTKLLKNALKANEKGINILLYGQPGTGKTELAKSLAGALNKKLYTICEERDRCKEPGRNDRLYALKLSDFILGNSQNLFLLDEAEDIFRSNLLNPEPMSKVFMNRFLEENAHPILWTTNDIHCMDPAFLRRFTYIVEFKKPNVQIRQKIWQKTLQKNHLELADNEVHLLAQNYDIPPALIQSVAKSTKLAEGTLTDIQNTLSAFEKALGQRYQKNTSNTHNFNASLLNTDTDMENLANRLSQLGKTNFSLCLYGAPGTGKSAYARYIAEKLNMEVVEKRASNLFGSHVGESEKNIAQAFEEAKQKKALLIFDEADSLLRDRTLAHYSWEISQVNEMLTWMEQHPYPFVCTTNLIDHLDKASLRRFTFKVKYNYLSPEQIATAFEHFFGHKITPQNLAHLNCVSPGDFVVVKEKAQILDYMDNPQQLITMLQNEIALKDEKNVDRKIGFV